MKGLSLSFPRGGVLPTGEEDAEGKLEESYGKRGTYFPQAGPYHFPAGIACFVTTA